MHGPHVDFYLDWAVLEAEVSGVLQISLECLWMSCTPELHRCQKRVERVQEADLGSQGMGRSESSVLSFRS